MLTAAVVIGKMLSRWDMIKAQLRQRKKEQRKEIFSLMVRDF